MKKNYYLFILLVLVFKLSLAQKEASHWYFGQNAGLDFNSGGPVVVFNGSLNTLEGCATISDSNGNLLFYTDGTTVWNRNHLIMPTGKGLFGNSSSTQSAIIVPKPKNLTTYFIFTSDWAGGENGLNFYTVDMTLDGGLGDVIGVNNIPTETNLLLPPGTEKITAVKVLNEDAFWVISLKQDRFYVFKVDNNGVSETPVIGNNGFTISSDPRGYLKASPDGTKLVSANMSSGIFMYDFDSSNGVVTYQRQLNVLGEYAYGVEFSPLSKKLYVSTGDFNANLTPALEKLLQFNLDIPDPTSDNINGTLFELHSYTNQRAALQIGSDGKIYRARDGHSFLGAITNPEGDGVASNYVHDAINLEDRTSGQGLPPFIQSFFAASIETNNICLGDDTDFMINSNKPVLSIVWDFGDGTPTSTALSPTHTYSLAGDYIVNVQITTADDVETISQTITIFDLPNISPSITLQQCDDDTDGISSFNLREVEYLSSSASTTEIFTYHFSYADAEANTGLITNLEMFSNATANQLFIRVENQLGCYRIAELNLQVTTSNIPSEFKLDFNECDTDDIDGNSNNGIASFNFSSATDTILNLFPEGQNILVTYYETIAEALVEENEIDITNYRNENSPYSQKLIVRVDNQNDNSCLGLGFHITLNVNPLPEFDLLEQDLLCLNFLPDPIILAVENPQGNYMYEWKNKNGEIVSASSMSTSVEVFETGDYFVTATSIDNCQTTKKITVLPSSIAAIQRIDVVDDSENNTITVITNGEGDYEFALNNENGLYQDENIFENVPGGIHTVFVRDKNGCGLISQEVSIIAYPKFFTPNGDGFNDTWQILGIGFQPISKIYIFDRFGKVLVKLDGNSQGWDGTYQGHEMIQSDYWFKVELEDGRFRKGHFSLIRR